MIRQGRDDEAINVARNGLAVSPYDSGLHFALGLALARKDDLMTATNQFAYALLLGPDWMEAHLNFGRALLHLGDAPNGLRHFQEAVRLAPDSPLALNGLAWFLATYPDATLRNGPEAVRLAEHGLCRDRPQEPDVARHLGGCVCRSREISRGHQRCAGGDCRRPDGRQCSRRQSGGKFAGVRSIGTPISREHAALAVGKAPGFSGQDFSANKRARRGLTVEKTFPPP